MLVDTFVHCFIDYLIFWVISHQIKFLPLQLNISVKTYLSVDWFIYVTFPMKSLMTIRFLIFYFLGKFYLITLTIISILLGVFNLLWKHEYVYMRSLEHSPVFTIFLLILFTSLFFYILSHIINFSEQNHMTLCSSVYSVSLGLIL